MRIKQDVLHYQQTSVQKSCIIMETTAIIANAVSLKDMHINPELLALFNFATKKRVGTERIGGGGG